MSNLNENVIPFGALQHGDYKLEAVEKLRKECEDFNGREPMGRAIKDALVKFLVSACNENEVVAEVIYRTVRTLGDCCDYVTAEIKKKNGEQQKVFNTVIAASDTEVYTVALRFYFPNSEVKAQISLSFGQMPSEEEMAKAYDRPAPPPRSAKSRKEKKGTNKKRSEEQPLLDGFDILKPEEDGEEPEEEPMPAAVIPVPVFTEKCTDCGKGISDSDAAWSLSQFGKKLCVQCQKAASARKDSDERIQLSLF